MATKKKTQLAKQQLSGAWEELLSDAVTEKNTLTHDTNRQIDHDGHSLSSVVTYLQVTCLVQPPITPEAATDAAAASAIAVYVQKPRPDVPDSSAAARPFPCIYGPSRRLPKRRRQMRIHVKCSFPTLPRLRIIMFCVREKKDNKIKWKTAGVFFLLLFNFLL